MKRALLILACMYLPAQIYAQDIQPEAPDPVWQINSKYLMCMPKQLYRGDTLILQLGIPHGSELGIRRESDNTWYYLVIHSPDSGYNGLKNIMDPQQFADARKVQLSADMIAYNAIVGLNEKIFSSPGKYDIYATTSLESEDGGYKCVVNFVGVRSPKH